MAYFMLVKGKTAICRGASTWRNKAGWHDLTWIARPLSGSGYRAQGRDELNRRVEVKMDSGPRGSEISNLLARDKVLPWVAVEAGSDDKASLWWTFFDVELAGYSSGTDDSSPTGASMSYIFEFSSARFDTGAWPGAARTEIPQTGLDPGRAVDNATNHAVTNLPVPSSLKKQYY